MKLFNIRYRKKSQDLSVEMKVATASDSLYTCSLATICEQKRLHDANDRFLFHQIAFCKLIAQKFQVIFFIDFSFIDTL